MSHWPDPYVPDPDSTNSPMRPTWTREQARKAGAALADEFLKWPLSDIPESYREFARQCRLNVALEHIDEYRELIKRVFKGDYSTFNSNDFANVHHVAWLLLGRALASLTNLNPHGDWGDPPINGSFHFEADPPQPGNHPRFYHFVPNGTGYYAVGTSDSGLAPPNLGA